MGNDAHITVSEQPDGTWLVNVEVSYAGLTASEQLSVQEQADPDDPPHLPLVSARAWHALAIRHQEAGQLEEAIACLQQGLEVLGTHYRVPRVKDDTTLKLGAARDLIEAGRLADATNLKAQMLALRMRHYEQKYDLERKA